MIQPESAKTKFWRRVSIYSLTATLLIALFLFLLWQLRVLILPTIVGALAAYLCRPLLSSLKRKGLSHGISILVLFTVFAGLMGVVAQQISANIPDDNEKLVLRARIQYKANQKFTQFMGLNEDPKKGNFFHQLLGADLKPSFDSLNNAIMFDPTERIIFELYVMNKRSETNRLDTYYDYYLENIRNDQLRLGKNFIKDSKAEKAQEEALAPEAGKESLLTTIKDVVSLWLATPFVFLFLLLDEGQIKKNLVYLVPNQYFEMILTMIDNVDEAIGNYLRGTVIECSLVGLTFMICLYLIGIDVQLAFAIGLIAGLANAIPFLGPIIGLLAGAGYALIAEDISPWIPGVTVDSLLVWVLISVVIAQGLDNAVFQPIVLGSAVSLHPLVVIMGVMGGGVLLGMVGMLFAIPAIVIFKVIFTTFFDQMKAYHII